MLRSVTCLAGGVGAARFLEGLAHIYPNDRITVIVNTGDDFQYFGCNVSPDLDIVTYTLAGIVNQEKGYGLNGDDFRCMQQLDKFLPDETWFRLGDRDFAIQLFRTSLLQRGMSLSEVTERIRKALGVEVRILPMSNELIATKIKTPKGLLDFQEYFVKRKCEDEVEGVEFDGANEAAPADGVLEYLREADVVILCPSNPILSISPILAIPGVRKALSKTLGRVVGVSPIVGGKALKGPLDRILKSLGFEVSPYGVALLYKDFMQGFVIDDVDRSLSPNIEALGMNIATTRSIMDSLEAKMHLARVTLELAENMCK